MRSQFLARIALHWRVLAFFGVLILCWVPWALLTYGVAYLTNQIHIVGTVALVTLYLCFLINAWFWGRIVHRWLTPWKQYGLIFCDRFFKDCILSLGIGFSLVVFLFSVETWLGWANLHTPTALLPIALEGLTVGLGVGFAEELLFRGWLLAELQTELSKARAILWSGLLFAVAHFIKPLPEIISTSPQFLGLLLLGLILGMGRYLSYHRSRFTSLGIPLGLHAGLVWGYYIVDVADLVTPTHTVPEWVTGIHGNPLSGALGVTILSILAIMTWLKLRSK